MDFRDTKRTYFIFLCFQQLHLKCDLLYDGANFLLLKTSGWRLCVYVCFSHNLTSQEFQIEYYECVCMLNGKYFYEQWKQIELFLLYYKSFSFTLAHKHTHNIMQSVFKWMDGIKFDALKVWTYTHRAAYKHVDMIQCKKIIKIRDCEQKAEDKLVIALYVCIYFELFALRIFFTRWKRLGIWVWLKDRFFMSY